MNAWISDFRAPKQKEDALLLSPPDNEYTHLKSSLPAEMLSWISLKATPLYHLFLPQTEIYLPLGIS